MDRATTRSKLAGPLLAFVLAAGAAIVWGAATVTIGAILYITFLAAPESEDLVFSVDGQALVQTYDVNSGRVVGARYRTLDGRPFDAPDTQFTQLSVCRLSRPADLPYRQTFWYSSILSFRQGTNRPTFWYLVHDRQPEGHAYLVGYDSKSKMLVGYLGLAGFRTEKPPIKEQFAIDSRAFNYGAVGGIAGFFQTGAQPANWSGDAGVLPLYVMSGDTLWRVDTGDRSVKQVPLAATPVSLGQIQEPPELPNKTFLAVRFDESIKLLDDKEQVVRTIPVPQEFRESRLLDLYATSGPEVILVDMSIRYGVPWEIRWIDRDGQVTRQARVQIAPDMMPAYRQVAWWLVPAFPGPLPYVGVFAITVPNGMLMSGQANLFTEALDRTWPLAVGPLLVTILLSIPLAVFAYRHARRNGLAGAPFWALFVLVLGLPGLVGYLVHRHWPARERCPKCGAIVPRDREICLACAAEFPQPKLTGVEVFA